MLRKIVTAIIVVPLVVVIVAFAVANRQAVTVTFDPFSPTNPAYAVTLPLFIVLFVALILGVLVGGFAAWLRQGKWRRTARRIESEFRSLHQEHDALRRRVDTAARPPQGAPGPPLGISPPAA